MQRQNERRIVRDTEIRSIDRDTLATQLGDLVHEMMRINDDAIADDR